MRHILIKNKCLLSSYVSLTFVYSESLNVSNVFRFFNADYLSAINLIISITYFYVLLRAISRQLFTMIYLFIFEIHGKWMFPGIIEWRIISLDNLRISNYFRPKKYYSRFRIIFQSLMKTFNSRIAYLLIF